MDLLIFILLIINIPIYMKIFKVLFPNKGDFWLALSSISFDNRFNSMFSFRRTEQTYVNIFFSSIVGILILEITFVWIFINVLEVYNVL